MTAAQAFFCDQVDDLGKLSSFLNTNGTLDLMFTLSLTDATNALLVNDFVLGNSSFLVPEPSTWRMIAVGGIALLGMVHRKRRRAK